MKLSLSVRIAEGFLSKEEAVMDITSLADLAASAGYEALCMRASQVGVQTPVAGREEVARAARERGLAVSMVSGDFAIVYNNDRAPECLRNITPYLDLADRLGSKLVRVAVKEKEDIPEARRAADEAAERGIYLVHQCHTLSLFETVEGIEAALTEIGRPNFGLIFEAANLELCGQSYGEEALRRLAPWIRNVYLQNQQLNPAGAVTLETWCRGLVSFDLIQIPETGGIDFERVFAGLKSIGYDGWVTVHQSAPESGSPAESARQTADYLKALIG